MVSEVRYGGLVFGLSRKFREAVSALIYMLGESTLAMTGNIKHAVLKDQTLPFRTFVS